MRVDTVLTLLCGRGVLVSFGLSEKGIRGIGLAITSIVASLFLRRDGIVTILGADILEVKSKVVRPLVYSQSVKAPLVDKHRMRIERLIIGAVAVNLRSLLTEAVDKRAKIETAKV